MNQNYDFFAADDNGFVNTDQIIRDCRTIWTDDNYQFSVSPFNILHDCTDICDVCLCDNDFCLCLLRLDVFEPLSVYLPTIRKHTPMSQTLSTVK